MTHPVLREKTSLKHAFIAAFGVHKSKHNPERPYKLVFVWRISYSLILLATTASIASGYGGGWLWLGYPVIILIYFGPFMRRFWRIWRGKPVTFN